MFPHQALEQVAQRLHISTHRSFQDPAGQSHEMSQLALHEADVGPEIFRILSNVNDPMNLQALAHPACPVTVLQRLAGSLSPSVAQ